MFKFNRTRCLTAVIFLVLSMTQAFALTIGTNANYPPFSSLADKDNHFTGFDIDIMQAICKRINMPCTYTPILAQDVTTNLVAGSIDLAIAAIVIPEKPSPYFIYSLPYMVSQVQFIVKQGSAIKTLADIKSKKIGTRKEPLFSEFIRTRYGDQANITEYPRLSILMFALDQGSIDVAVTRDAAINYWMANEGGQYRLIGNPMSIGNGYGVMANVENAALIQKVNQAIQDMMADGSYVRIYSKYF